MSEGSGEPPEERPATSGAKARKWLLGLVVAGIAAAITSYVSGGINWGVDHVRGAIEEAPAPIGISVERIPSRGGTNWVFTQPINALLYPKGIDRDSVDEWDAWAQQHQGLEGFMTAVEFIVEGIASSAVVLTGLRIELIDRRPPPRGVVVQPFGGAPVGVRHFQVDLCASPPTVESIEDEFEPIPAVKFPYRVTPVEPEAFNIRAYAEKCDATWRARLEWRHQGKTGSTVIDNGGEPFRTVSGSQSSVYTADKGQFVPAN